MIERMKRITVVCLEDAREETVRELGALGSVHVAPVIAPQSGELEHLLREQENVARAKALLAARELDESSGDLAPAEAERVVARILDADAEKRKCQDRIQEIHRELEQLAPWGSFSRSDLDALRQRGLYVSLCRMPEHTRPELPDGSVVHEISRHGKVVYLAVVTTEPPPEALVQVPLPEDTDIKGLRLEMDEMSRRVDQLERGLRDFVGAEEALADYAVDLADTIALTRARDGMGSTGKLTYLTGFVPVSRVSALRDSAAAFGWGLRIEDVPPDAGDVPVLLRMPRVFRIAKPIFDFVGILPGYNECDVSVSVLLFLTLFFGMIVGDAGYGALFLATGVFVRVRARKPSSRRWANLFLVLSTATLVWGALNGTWFAIPATSLPRWMQGVDWFADSAAKNRHIQWLCFLVGAIHLSMARLWRAALTFRTRQALGYIGWAMLIWGNFFTAVELIVSKGSFPGSALVLYGVGAVLIFTCGVNWRDVGGIMNLPFDFIGSFVDVLSYIRLFAVGLSSYFIAASFNSMGRMVLDLSPWLFPAAVVIIAFGHLLNVALAFMGVLVHGIRLNTLEFSNHMELTWSGRPYKPLKRSRAPS